ncbi:hypothetical protein LTR08_005261 [Meristemomyces frigidus]|nr:hypothetical protein LTR08_005261 [Meristemomyces frigidus]
MDLISILRLSYLGAAFLVVLIYLIPALHDRFLTYGARAASPATPHAAQEKVTLEQPAVAPYAVLLNYVAEIKVPHSWFTSFYALSVSLSLLWASQIMTGGPGYRAVAHWTAESDASMTFRQVIVAWAMLLVQGSRRLYECLAFSKPSSSQMWVGHWVLGILFYSATSLAVWVEGIPALQAHTFTFSDVAIAAPNLQSIISILIFILASGFQHDCHTYLASLKSTPKRISGNEARNDGYKLPDHLAFSGLIAPHYNAECIIYMSLAILAAPQGMWLNWTMVCALVFVAVNLGVTADGTKGWYERRFGKQAVEGKARMVPLIW